MAWKNINVVDEGVFIETPDGQSWCGEAVLSEAFYKGVINQPVPIDMRVLRALRNSSLALDLYCWLTYRVSYLSRPTDITWDALMKQFGGEYTDVRDFRRQAVLALQRIQKFWPVNIDTPRGRLRILPTKPHVARVQVATSPTRKRQQGGMRQGKPVSLASILDVA